MIKSLKVGSPNIHPDTFISETADIIGRVEIKQGTSVWYQAVIRADVNTVTIGSNCNVQDGCIIHCSPDAPTVIGNDVSVGHQAIVHGCTIGDRCLIGIGSIILDKAEIGEDCIIAAGALVLAGKKIPPRSLVMGVPGKVVREVTPEDMEGEKERVLAYVNNWRQRYQE